MTGWLADQARAAVNADLSLTRVAQPGIDPDFGRR
jgi:hypothetical protein